jgi:hypothetical protein
VVAAVEKGGLSARQAAARFGLGASTARNPIEQVFAKLKHQLRKAAARTVETVCAAIGELLGTFSKDECANYFTNSGYAH